MPIGKISHKSTKMLNEELLARYKAKGGQRCYFCHWTDLYWGSGEFTVVEGEMEAQQEVDCPQCGGSWLDVYTFKRIIVARDPRDNEL